MKETKTKSKKKVLYYVLLAVCALVLAAATVLTVYFVAGGGNEVLEKPNEGTQLPDGNDNPGGDTPSGGENPGGDTPSGGEQKPDDKPTGGGTLVSFVAPVSGGYAAEYNEIYLNGLNGWYYRHAALDFAAEEGTEVASMANGTIAEISYNENTGNYIVVDHGDGLKSLYRFVEPAEGLKVGDSVKAGDKIATVAAAYGSEAAEGTHLHFETTLNGNPVNPAGYIDVVLAEK